MKIAVLDDYQGVALALADWSRLQSEYEVDVFTRAFSSEKEAAEALRDYNIICIMRERTPFPATMFAALPNLELLVTTGNRNAAIDLNAASAGGVMVCGTGAPGLATAELTWGLILSLTRNLSTELKALSAGAWQTTVGTDLAGKRLGILGLGKLGARVARIGNAFEMDVVAWSQNLTEERAAECGARRLDKMELLSSSDVVTIHLKLSERTTNLVGWDELAAMKPTSYLINTSRAPIIDMQALGRALREGQIAGAGIDVYDTEPVPEDADIRSWPNAVMTPHIGYVTRETYEIFYGGTVAAIEAWIAGQPIEVMAHPA